MWIKDVFVRTVLCFLLFIFSFFQSVSVSADDLIKDVHMTAPMLETEEKNTNNKQEYQISWSLAVPGKLSVFICDVGGNIVHTFMKKEEKPEGSYSVTWDGLDESGSLCSTGIYFPVLRIKSKTKGVETYNPTALPWGEMISAYDVHYDSAQQVIKYSINELALCRVRIGGEGESDLLYRSVADWKLQAPGSYTEPWDGMDSSGVLDVAGGGKYKVFIEAFSVPENAIMLNNPTAQITQDSGKYTSYPVSPPHGANVVFSSFGSEGLQPDFTLVTWFPGNVKNNAGQYRLSGQAPVGITFSSKEVPDEIVKRGLKLIIYVGNKVIDERLVKQLPIQYALDTLQFSNGEHLVTVNLKTAEYRASSSSMGIIVDN